TSFDAPVIFVEIGSSEDEWSLPDAGEALSKGAWAAATLKAAGRRAVGFGGDHYCSRFTEAVLSCELAVGHAFPRYNFPGLKFDVVSCAFTRTVGGCSLAAVDWRGLKSR
ncbi:MAG: hypothetical protein GTO54_08540, partial [Nitrososphaeria archaeon]|nr:hypothetical protein [Nitrososphaeria archaeon]